MGGDKAQTAFSLTVEVDILLRGAVRVHFRRLVRSVVAVRSGAVIFSVEPQLMYRSLLGDVQVSVIIRALADAAEFLAGLPMGGRFGGGAAVGCRFQVRVLRRLKRYAGYLCLLSNVAFGSQTGAWQIRV